jgi:hypothetical protein
MQKNPHQTWTRHMVCGTILVGMLEEMVNDYGTATFATVSNRRQSCSHDAMPCGLRRRSLAPSWLASIFRNGRTVISYPA